MLIRLECRFGCQTKEMFYQVHRCGVHTLSKLLHCVRPRATIRQARKMCLNANLSEYSNLITNLEMEKQISLVLKQYEDHKQKSRKLPSVITVEDMQELLTMEYWERIRHLRHLWKIERVILEDEKRENEQQNLNAICDPVPSFLDASLLEESLQRYHYTQKLCSVAMYGQPLVFDLSYDEEMRSDETLIAVKNLDFMYGDNRYHRDPFDLHFCNVDYNKPTGQMLRYLMHHLYDPTSVLQIETRSYTELFPRERLLYLSPNSEETLTTYDHDAIYIIGALVELSERKPSSLVKAEKEGIRTAKLPLKEFTPLICKRDCLRMREVINILLEVKSTGDWESAISGTLERADLLET